MDNILSKSQKIASCIFIISMIIYTFGFIYINFIPPAATDNYPDFHYSGLIIILIMSYPMGMCALLSLNYLIYNGKFFNKNHDELEMRMNMEAYKYASIAWLLMVLLSSFSIMIKGNFFEHLYHLFWFPENYIKSAIKMIGEIDKNNLEEKIQIADKLNRAISLMHSETRIIFIIVTSYMICSLTYAFLISRFYVWLKYR